MGVSNHQYTSNADFCEGVLCNVELTLLRVALGSGGPTWKDVLEGFVSFSRILFMSLTVSPREKYSSRTNFAVLTRSRLAPVILKFRYN